MDKQKFTLDEIPINGSGIIIDMQMDGILRKKLIDMGLVRGTKFKVDGRAPLGDPIKINLRGYYLTIRKNDAKKIIVEKNG